MPPDILSVTDSDGNVPLHSAMREDMDLASVKCLIRFRRCTRNLFMGTCFLHLACCSRADQDAVLVREVALASTCSHSRVSPVLEPNWAGLTHLYRDSPLINSNRSVAGSGFDVAYLITGQNNKECSAF